MLKHLTLVNTNLKAKSPDLEQGNSFFQLYTTTPSSMFIPFKFNVL
ncbi:hypothetical protein FORMB_17940 [Formosa sp. Hel1_33_131]|nr:hypothetical protein FORMB_17940 [Formosa sp. Hel1_33_131]